MTHCSSNYSSIIGESCFNDDKMTCMDAIKGAEPLNIDYRDRVYLGQFRTIGRYTHHPVMVSTLIQYYILVRHWLGGFYVIWKMEGLYVES